MKVKITGCPADKPIQAIKAVRSATGLGLREAKDVFDDVINGIPTVVNVTGTTALYSLRDGGVTFDVVDTAVGVSLAVREALSQMPPYMSVGDVLRVLEAVL